MVDGDSGQEPVRVLIGAGQFDRIPALVTEHSIRKTTSREVEVFHTFDRERPGGEKGRKTAKNPVYATDFTIVRFWLPELCGRRGRGIYLDSDMLLFEDIGLLHDTPMDDKWVLQAPNQSAVMLCDCSKLDWDAWKLDEWVGHDSRRYAQAMQSLCGTPPQRIGLLDQRWNHTDHYHEGETRLLHYTRLLTQPWNYPGKHPLEGIWWKALQDAIDDGFIQADDPDVLDLPAYGHAARTGCLA